MVDVLLHQRSSASDAATAGAVVRSVLGTGDIATAGGPLAYTQWALVDDGVAISRIVSEGTRVRLTIERSPDLVVLSVHEGRVELQRGGLSAAIDPGGCGLIDIEESSTLVWDEARFELFSLPLSTVLRMLGGEAGEARLHAPRITPRTPALGAHWRRIAALLGGQVLADEDLYGRDLVRSTVIDALTAATIEAFEITDTTADDPNRDEQIVARAGEYMAAHLGAPISIPDVAQATGLSVRGLQVVYQRQGEETPLGHLRRLRLAAARRALETSAPGATVTGIARRVGYTNIGRFGAHYRAAYGESPSATLQGR